MLTETKLLPFYLPPRKRWTRAECEKLEAVGTFEQEHLELIEGELIDKIGKARPHVNAVKRLVDWLIQVFGTQFVLQEAPIDVAPKDNPRNEPEPDAIVLRREYLEFVSNNPQPEAVRLLVEVADTSIYMDLQTKADLNARAEIAEYWVLGLTSRRLIVHRTPQAGRYLSVVAYGENEKVAPLAAPDSELRVSDVFPK